MSILMQALKQQHQSVPGARDSGVFWRKMALVLALLLACCIGALAAYWLTPITTERVTAEPVSVADPATILAALHTGSDETAPGAELVSATVVAPTRLQSQLNEALSPPPEPIQEQFVSPPPIASMTAGTAAAEPKPLTAAEVSGELRDKFASAMQATETVTGQTAPRSHNAPATDIRSLDRQLQQQIPPLRFDAHVYATTVSQRWVKVNGKTLQEGQWVTADIRVKEIMPQFVLLQWGSQLFSMAALTEWPGA